MSLTYVIQNLRNRVPWSVIKTLMRSRSLSTGQGWDAVLIKLLEKVDEDKDFEHKAIQELTDYFAEHILCAEKAISFHQIESGILDKLLSKITQLEVKENKFTEKYPFPLDEAEISDSSECIELTKIFDSENEVTMVFCSIRSYEATVNLDIDDLNEDAVKEHNLEGFTQIVAKKRLKRQFYDVVNINKKTGMLQLRMDWGFGMSVMAFVKAVKSTRATLQSFLKEILDEDINLGSPLNLFPLIKSLYETENSSRVCEIGFTTNSGSVKLEKMRRTPIDLRVEDYHLGGKQAVEGQLSLYRIALIWTRTHSKHVLSYPELLLPGRLKSLSQPEPYLENAIVTKIFDRTDFYFITSLIEEILVNDE